MKLFSRSCYTSLMLRLKSKNTVISCWKRSASAINVSPNKEEQPAESQVSTLFVPGRHTGSVYRMVEPIIDLKYFEENASNISASCKARNIKLDLQYFLNIMKEWSTKKDKHVMLTNKYQELLDEAKKLKELDLKEEADVIQKKAIEFLDEVKLAKNELYDIEDIAMPLCGLVPNIIDPSTPIQDDSIKVHIESKRQCLIFTHCELADSLSILEFSNVSPKAYFLKGPLAEMELAVLDYFSLKLQGLDFAPMSCADFVKSFIVEATGLNPYSYNDIIPLKSKKTSSNVITNNNLVGGASFQSLCAYLVNMNSSVETLPMKYYSLGRHYEASNRPYSYESLFNVVQSSRINCMTLSEPTNQHIEFDSMLNAFISCYSELGLPFRTVEVAAPRLNCTESRRVQLELWSPGEVHWVPVAHVSQRNDFVSKRLHISYGVLHNVGGYCNIVEGVFVNVPVLLGCLLEHFASNVAEEVDFESIFKLLGYEK